MIPFLHEFAGRVRSLFHKRRSDREIAEELEFHQTLMREKLMKQGLPQSDAAYEVRRNFGNPARWQERLREVWQFRWWENFRRDVIYSARLLRKSPGFTAIALLTLTLGVGANTAVFSLIDTLLLRSLPVPHPEQLAVLRQEEGREQPNYSFCTPFFRSLEARHDVFSDVFAYDPETFQVHGQAGNENVYGMLVKIGRAHV